MSWDVIIFAEDPGAANYILDLPGALKQQELTSVLIALDPALTYLKNKSVDSFSLPEEISATEIFEKFHPKLLVVGTSENPATKAFDLILTARERGIISIGYIDNNANADYRFRGYTEDPLIYAPDFLLVPDESTRQAFFGLGYPEKNIILCGHPYYDQILMQKKYFQKQGERYYRQKLFPTFSDLQRPIISFIAEISTGLNQEQYRLSKDYTLQGWSKSEERTAIVLEEFLTGIKTLKTKPYLVLRLHPKNTEEEFKAYKNFFDAVSQKESALEIVYASELVVGMSSSVLQESFLLGKKTLSILPREIEKNWVRPEITVATNATEIKLKLLQKLNEKNINVEVSNETALKRIVKFIKSKLIPTTVGY